LRLHLPPDFDLIQVFLQPGEVCGTSDLEIGRAYVKYTSEGSVVTARPVAGLKTTDEVAKASDQRRDGAAVGTALSVARWLSAE
jgi:hypothetical protein